MRTKKTATNLSTKSRKKRCANGYRRDKKTDECVKYEGIKVFKNLKDQNISETKNTLTIESLGEKGAIMKTYESGQLKTQVFVSEQALTKANQAGQKDIQHIIDIIHRVKKDPAIVNKDKAFKRFQKKLLKTKLGGGRKKTISTPTEVLVQEDIVDKFETNKIQKLQDKIEQLEHDIKKEQDSYSLKSINVVFALSNLIFGKYNYINYNTDLITSTVPQYVVDFDNGMPSFHIEFAQYQNNLFMGDFIADMVLSVISLCNIISPDRYLSVYLRYIIYTAMITTDIVYFSTVGWVSLIEPIIGIVLTTTTLVLSQKGEKELLLEKELQETKEELVKALAEK
jgi:hypothetical protein